LRHSVSVITGELVSEDLDYDDGRQVTVYVAQTRARRDRLDVPGCSSHVQ
jgi:hypothetical protein